MTDYERIVACLREYKLLSLESWLCQLVKAELGALSKGEHKGGRAGERAMQQAHEAARSYYASEILEDLFVPRELTPESVLYHRRSANVWAIAALMRAAGCRAFFEPSKKGT